MKHHYRKFSTLFVLFLTSLNALAWDCPPPPPLCNLYWETAHVFIGNVKEIDPSNYSQMISFDIEKSYRGIASPNVEISVNDDYKVVNFQKGKKYLVFANDYQGKLMIDTLCPTTGLLEKSGEALEFLNSLFTNTPKFEIYGKAYEPYSPLKVRLNVEVTNGLTSYSTVSNEYGRFFIPVSKAGEYRVKIQLPPGNDYTFGGNREYFARVIKRGIVKKRKFVEYLVKVEPNHCAFVVVGILSKENADF